jgi:hypothetical protein
MARVYLQFCTSDLARLRILDFGRGAPVLVKDKDSTPSKEQLSSWTAVNSSNALSLHPLVLHILDQVMDYGA